MGKKKVDEDDREYLELGDGPSIGEQARKIFENKLPRHWIQNELKRDFGKDYTIEIFTKSSIKSTGDLIYIQLKGEESPTFVNNGASLSHPLGKRHLGHWNQVKVPVFLLVVDIQTKKGYWLFMQDYLEANRGWNKSKEHSVRIPVENCWDDWDKWEEEAKRAIKSMRTRSAAFADVAQHHLIELSQIENRFDYRATASKEGIGYQLIPKEAVELTISIMGESQDRHACLMDLFDKGGEIKLNDNEYKITGSPLFEMRQGGRLEINMVPMTGVSVSLICHDERGRTAARLAPIHGVIEGGLTEKRFLSTDKDMPITVTIGPINQQDKIVLSVNSNLIIWLDQPIQELSHFDEVYRFFEALVRHKRLGAECKAEGQLLFSLPVNPSDTEPFERLISILHFTHMARTVAQYHSTNLPCSSLTPFDYSDHGQVEIAYDLITKGRYDYPQDRFYKLTTFIDSDVIRSGRITRSVQDHEMVFRDEKIVSFMGERINLGYLAITCTDGRLDCTEEEFEAMRQASGEVRIGVDCKILSMRRTTPDEIERILSSEPAL